jgi:large subunit ribosomal protein L18
MTIKNRRKGRDIRHQRVRKKVFGTPEKPRLAVFRSLRHISGQLIDDTSGKTLCAITTNTKEFKEQNKSTGCVEAATKVGKLLGGKIKALGVSQVVFDRGGYLYHGRVKAFAEGTREAGIDF